LIVARRGETIEALASRKEPRMPTVMKMRWEGVTPEQYDTAREAVGWEEEPASGGIFHVAWFADGALNVVDVWDSGDAWNRFSSERLMPGLQPLGLPGQPHVELHETHRHFAPGYLTRA
jgi:hypothetical protein